MLLISYSIQPKSTLRSFLENTSRVRVFLQTELTVHAGIRFSDSMFRGFAASSRKFSATVKTRKPAVSAAHQSD